MIFALKPLKDKEPNTCSFMDIFKFYLFSKIVTCQKNAKINM